MSRTKRKSHFFRLWHSSGFSGQKRKNEIDQRFFSTTFWPSPFRKRPWRHCIWKQNSRAREILQFTTEEKKAQIGFLKNYFASFEERLNVFADAIVLKQHSQWQFPVRRQFFCCHCLVFPFHGVSIQPLSCMGTWACLPQGLWHCW